MDPELRSEMVHDGWIVPFGVAAGSDHVFDELGWQFLEDYWG